MMTLLPAVTLALIVPAVILTLAGPRAGAFVAMAAALTVLLIVQRSAGVPAAADGRLAAESWRLLSVAPLADNHFLIAVKYANGSLRAYDLDIADPGQRDAFLKAAQSIKKGHALQGRAGRGRAGLINDSDMSFSFAEVPDSSPKDPPQ